MGAGPMVLPRGVGGEKPPTSPSKQGTESSRLLALPETGGNDHNLPEGEGRLLFDTALSSCNGKEESGSGFQFFALFIGQAGVFGVAGHDAAFRLFNKFAEHFYFRDIFYEGIGLDGGESIFSIKAFEEEDFDSVPEGESFFVIEAGSAQADDIGACDEIHFAEHAERGYVLSDHRGRTDHCEGTDAAELVNEDVSGDDGSGADLDVTAEGGLVGDGHAVSEDAVMSDMYECLEQDMVTDNSFQEFEGRPMDRHIFPEHGIRADFHEGADAAVEAVVLRFADIGAEIDAAARSDCRILSDFNMGVDITIIPDFHIVFDHGIRTDLHIFSDFSLR